MKLSMRNNFKGTVKSIEMGAVNADVVVEVAPGMEMSSIITKKSCESLGLAVGKEVRMLVKASNVMIGVE